LVTGGLLDKCSSRGYGVKCSAVFMKS